ncbi:uncharacterized protein [Procambarus clarkii]|uniref:uncharacterized protein isoform X2 n=1 Tax=Procambarus clarkii TaxID=6728 RepID=UPI003743951C
MALRSAGREMKGSPSPSLSAAASQVSLVPSELTTSDPDLAASSAYSSGSSRLPSSQESVTTITDLAPEDYTTEIVEFATSPQALKTGRGKNNGVCFVESHDGMRLFPSSTQSLLTPSCKPEELESSENSPKQDGFEVSSDLEEEYFEEFHLPNSHENAFVRHKSFRRKVNLTPIHAPDAEKIEGLLLAGEFQRHGSMRRKIVSEEITMVPEESGITDSFMLPKNNRRERDTDKSVSDVGTFARDLMEIENMLNDSEEVEDISGIVVGENLINERLLHDGPQQLHANTSTPKSSNTKNISDCTSADLSLNMTEETQSDESLSIEQSTLMKVRECLDFTKYKAIYNLSGRLQDILTPMEIEEVLNNSERYSEYVNKEVIQALQDSLQDQQNTNNSGNTDSGISSPKKIISVEGLDLDTVVKMDIRAVFDDSYSKICGSDTNISKRSSTAFIDEFEDMGIRFERRKSLRLGKTGYKELEVEGVFIESKSQDIGLKKIKAPTLDLSGSTSEEYTDVPDLSNAEITDTTVNKLQDSKNDGPYDNFRKVCSITVPVPDIVITSTCEGNNNDSSVSLLQIESSDVSDVASAAFEPISSNKGNSSEERSADLEFGSESQRKIISVAEDILQSPLEDDNISVESAFSQRRDGEEENYDFENEDIEISPFESSEPANMKYYMDLEPIPPPPPQMIPELSAAEETADERHWRSVVIGGVWRRIDMKVISPYRKCISHGGYLGKNLNAVIVICACQLPDRSRRDYNYVMDNLFLYVLSTLEQLIADDYILVYLAGGTPRTSVPSFHWLKRAYQMIDRKLRKNLKALHVVHPTFWVRAVVTFSRPFISTKFYRKLTFVNNLTELAQMVPLDQLNIPDAVKQADFELMIREKKKNLGKRRALSMTVR